MNKLKFTSQLLMAGFLIMSTMVARAQIVTTAELKWAHGLSSEGPWGTDCQYLGVDGGGNTITVGSFNGLTDFDPGTGTYNMNDSPSVANFYIWKASETGNFVWAKQVAFENFSPTSGYMFNVSSLTVDKNKGDIYITGTFADSTVDFDPGPGVAKLMPEMDAANDIFGQSMFILKLNGAGDFQWVKQIPTYNTGSINSGAMGKSQGENNLIRFTGFLYPAYDYVTGQLVPVDFNPGAGTAYITPATGGNNVGFVLTLDDQGEFVSAFKIGNDDSASLFSSLIETDKEGNMYVLGSFKGTSDIDPSAAVHTITSTDNINAGDMFLIKYNAAGAFQWVKQSQPAILVHNGLEYPAAMNVRSMSADTSGGLYLAATLNGPVNFDRSIAYGGNATLLNVANWMGGGAAYLPATAIVKYNTSGNFEWAKQIGGHDTANRAQNPVGHVSKDGHLYVSGVYVNNVDFDPGAENFQIGGKGNYIAKYDHNGSFIWAGKIAEGSSNDMAFSRDIKSGDNGDVYVCGEWSGGSMDFDPTPGIFTVTPVTNTNRNGYVVKLNVTSVDTTTPPPPTGINTVDNAITATIAPNPAGDVLNLMVSTALTNATVQIVNIAGQRVFTKSRLYGNNISLDLRNLAAGTYYMELQERDHKSTFKLVKR